MNSKTFITDVSSGLVQFLNEQIQKEKDFVEDVEIRLGTPSRDELESYGIGDRRPSFLRRVIGQTLTAHVVPFSIERTQAGRDASLQTEIVESDGESTYVSRRSPERYRIQYLILGPSLGCEMGQKLVSLFITLFFDHTQISLRLPSGDEEMVKLIEAASTHDERALKLLQTLGVHGAPVYVFAVECAIASGKIMGEDKRVQKRQISVHSSAQSFRKSPNQQQTVQSQTKTVPYGSP